MEFFKDLEIIKLAILGAAFIIGVSVCFYVAARETVELNRRRRAKKLMRNDDIVREIMKKQMIKEQIQHNQKVDNQSNDRSSLA